MKLPILASSWDESYRHQILHAFPRTSACHPAPPAGASHLHCTNLWDFIDSHIRHYPYSKIPVLNCEYQSSWFIIRRFSRVVPRRAGSQWQINYYLIPHPEGPLAATPFLWQRVTTQSAFPVPADLHPLMEVLDQPSRLPSDFAKHTHLRSTFYGWKMMSLNFLYGVFASMTGTDQTLTYFQACKHVVHIFIDNLMTADPALRPSPTCCFSDLFDACFRLHPSRNVSDFVALLTGTAYLFLAHCGLPVAYTRVRHASKLEHFISLSKHQYPYHRLSLSTDLFHTPSGDSVRFLVRNPPHSLVISRADELPPPLQPHLNTMLQFHQAYPLPPAVAIVLTHIQQGPTSWSACFSETPWLQARVNWAACLRNWERESHDHLFDLFSAGLGPSDAPSDRDVIGQLIGLLIASRHLVSHEAPIRLDDLHFEVVFAAHFERIPCATFAGFSELVTKVVVSMTT